MKGYYVVKEAGRVVDVVENLITDAGKIAISNALATGSSWARQIAIGADSTAAAAGNRVLGLEFARSPVDSINYSPNTPSAGKYRLIAKSELPVGLSGSIQELGVFSGDDSDQFSAPLSMTGRDEPWVYRSATGPDVWTDLSSLGGAFVTGGRAGDDRISLSTVTAFTNDRRIRLYGPFNLADVQSTDLFCIGADTTTGTAPATNIRFYTNETNFFSYAMPTITSTAAYRIFEYAKSNWSATGSPDWGSIEFIEINTTGTLVLTHIDTIRVKRSAPDPDNILVSRAIPSSAITKSEGTPLEIEYYVDLF